MLLLNPGFVSRLAGSVGGGPELDNFVCPVLPEQHRAGALARRLRSTLSQVFYRLIRPGAGNPFKQFPELAF